MDRIGEHHILMAHFAKMNDNTVIEVIVVNNADAPNESEGVAFCKMLFGAETEWLQCSYNGNMRKQYPGAGFTYDPDADIFISPRPYPSWSLDVNHDWQPPVPKPEGEWDWGWDEGTLSWKLVSL